MEVFGLKGMYFFISGDALLFIFLVVSSPLFPELPDDSQKMAKLILAVKYTAFTSVSGHTPAFTATMYFKKLTPVVVFPLLFLLSSLCSYTQMITGSWKGKINRQKVEVKIIQTGDSLRGTSYYYESATNYRRYSIRGYFDEMTNSAVWWDDQLLEERSTRFSLGVPGKVPMLSRADFNCPGGGKMMLDGTTAKKEKDTKPGGEVHLDKIQNPEFEDEWDYVIDNYTVGGNDPYIIDSIAGISQQPIAGVVPDRTFPGEKEKPVALKPPPVNKQVKQPAPDIASPKKEEPVVILTGPVKEPTIEEKFINRKKILIKEIPLDGDSLELRFYDNAEIDGDSISLFLNDKLLFTHIRLTGKAYSIKLATSDMMDNNELIMVAENLGSIPPNTSYMLAISGDRRYEAYLSSTEGSSAMIRFIKKKP